MIIYIGAFTFPGRSARGRRVLQEPCRGRSEARKLHSSRFKSDNKTCRRFTLKKESTRGGYKVWLQIAVRYCGSIMALGSNLLHVSHESVALTTRLPRPPVKGLRRHRSRHLTLRNSTPRQ
ncbi:hypothetical protein TNCV_2974931 [Trichonephila clavipes]|nr:hypothetical protein TNCV_2974931 [Trichonephila clavipes]